jgi:hypothetical protein
MDEVERLRQENSRLRAELAEVTTPPVPRRRLRRWTAAFLAFATAFLVVLSVVSTWTSRTALDTDKFVARVGPVIDQPEVRAAISTEIGDQLVDVLDLQQRLRPVLPDQLGFLAGPIASGAEDVVRRAVVRVVDSNAFRTVWYASLRLSHQEVVQLLTGSDARVQVVDGQVIVDLSAVVAQVLQNLQAQLPTVFGTAVSLQIPDNLPVDQIRSLLSRYLGIDLPDSFARVPILDADALDNARTGIKVVNLSVLLVAILALAAFVLALVASVNKRRTLLQVGLWSAVLTALVFFVVRAVTDQTIAGIDATIRPAAAVAVREVFSSLRGYATLVFWLGLLLALAMYLSGQGRFPARLRGWLRDGGRWTAARVRQVRADEGFASWAARHLDALRVGGVVVAAVLLLLLSSWTALLVVGVLLVLYEVGVTLFARSTPEAAAEVDLAADDAGSVGTPG